MPQDKKRRNKASNALAKLEKADVSVATTAKNVGDKRLVGAVAKLAGLADQPPLRALCGGLIAIGLIRGDRRLQRAGVAMLIAHQLATSTKSFIKRQVDRTRPQAMAERGGYHRGKGRHDHPDFNSFPSGHTAGAVAVARAFGRAYPQYRGGAYAAAAFASTAQVPRGKHFPSDVAAGTLIGLAAEALEHRLAGKSAPASTEAEQAPGTAVKTRNAH